MLSKACCFGTARLRYVHEGSCSHPSLHPCQHSGHLALFELGTCGRASFDRTGGVPGSLVGAECESDTCDM
jgi:hypothetical protein